MPRAIAAAVLAFVVAAVGLAAGPVQSPTTAPAADEARWLDAVDDWEAGRYPQALESLIALASGPSAAAFHDRIALLTGELYETIEITPDGRNPTVSPDAQYVAYQAGGAGGVITRLVQTRPALRVVAELPTNTVAFDPAGTRLAWLRGPSSGTPEAREIVIRELASGAEHVLPAPGLAKSGLRWTNDGKGILFVGTTAADPSQSDLFVVRPGASPEQLTKHPGQIAGFSTPRTGQLLLYYVMPPDTRLASAAEAHVLDLATGKHRAIAGVLPGTLTSSADGTTLAWIAPGPKGGQAIYLSANLAEPTTIRTTSGGERLASPALSPNGELVAYQFFAGTRLATDWEIYVSTRDGAHRRLTHEIQHDLFPQFLDDRTLLAVIGEPRHRRAHLYDVETGARTRLFANNTVRTLSPEYSWLPSADGRHVLIRADRDGDTISTARGLYLVDRTRPIDAAALRRRLDAQLATETDLRARMTAAYQPIADEVRAAVSRVSPTRVFECERVMASFGSKNVSRPGNAKAIEYLSQMYASFGYTPELQWFNAGRTADGPGPRTANVIARKPGTTDPELIYIASAHFDSVEDGPGADDNTSGTCALVEAARVMADRPLPATVVFASFTGEEEGLLGSEEFVRLALAGQWRVMGAVNNDMLGWAADSGRLDNTVRYSNRGIRDLQHGAAFLFTDLVTFDAHYYYGTDAHSFFDAWGDVFAGLGSYPILGNPNYHAPTDLPETVSVRQIAEAGKVTAATMMALASSPARLKNLTARRSGSTVELTWSPAPESGVTSYIVAYGPPDDPLRTRTTVTTPRATLTVPAGTQVSVKAINGRGLESWDWARVLVD